MNRLRNNTVENVKWIEVAGIALLFLLTPSIIGLPAIIYYVTSKRRPNKTNYYTFFICIAAYIGAVNATKHAGGDQINYAWAYLNVPTQGFIGSLKNIYGYRVAMGEKGATNISGEFMNGVYNYLGYYLTFGNYSLFIFLYSLMEIMLILMGVYHFSTQLKSPKMVLICGTITMCFFYMYFNLMLQIQKQFFGKSHNDVCHRSLCKIWQNDKKDMDNDVCFCIYPYDKYIIYTFFIGKKITQQDEQTDINDDVCVICTTYHNGTKYGERNNIVIRW